jgi:hypothetical protein
LFFRYHGPNEFGPASEFIRAQFQSQSEGKRTIFSHITVATDSSNIQVDWKKMWSFPLTKTQLVFNAIRQIIMEHNVKISGLGEI